MLSASYVGNHGYQEAVVDGGANAFGFDTLPANAPTGNFGQVNRVYSGASSNFNGLILSGARRGKVLSLQINYAYGHALDEISNGGFDAFGINPVNPINPYDLRQNYGNSDYDVRHYISGNYVINIPHFGGPRILTDGWMLAGTIFHSTGYPYSYIDSSTPLNYAGSILGMQTQRVDSIPIAADPATLELTPFLALRLTSLPPQPHLGSSVAIKCSGLITPIPTWMPARASKYLNRSRHA